MTPDAHSAVDASKYVLPVQAAGRSATQEKLWVGVGFDEVLEQEAMLAAPMAARDGTSRDHRFGIAPTIPDAPAVWPDRHLAEGAWKSGDPDPHAGP